MLATLIWWAGIVVDAVILLRGLQAGLLGKYSLLYCYVASMFSVEILRICANQFAPSLYPRIYWNSEVVVILVSYSVIAAIYTRALANYPGVAALGINILALTLVITLSIAGISFLLAPIKSWDFGTALLGRNLRNVEGALLFTLIWVIRHYRISMGRNLRGLIVGYAFFLATDIVSRWILFLSPSNQLSLFLRKSLPVTYLLTLLIWCLSLWRVHPEPARIDDAKIERDYEVLVRKTRGLFAIAS
jgi:hypothetical protein